MSERSDLDALLTDEQALLNEMVRAFARDEIAPRHEALDHAGTHPTDLVAALAGMGLCGVVAPAELGGAGAGFLAQLLALEAVGEAAGAAAGILAAHGIALDALALAGGHAGPITDAVAGAALLAPALQEADGGALTTTASGGAITGVKVQVAFPGRAGGFVVLAGDATVAGGKALFFVAGDARGITCAPTDRRLSLLGLETATVTFTAAPAVALGGAELIGRVMASAHMQVGAVLAGIGRGALVHAGRYARERRQFDKPLIDFLAMRERLGRSDARVAAARALVHGAARLRDRGEAHVIAAARARFVAAEAAMSAADDALQVYGGYGYSREYPVERFYRDARFTGFGEPHAALLASALAGDDG